jgi:hypothetical protein
MGVASFTTCTKRMASPIAAEALRRIAELYLLDRPKNRLPSLHWPLHAWTQAVPASFVRKYSAAGKQPEPLEATLGCLPDCLRIVQRAKSS